MLSDTFAKFEALPENIRALVEAPEKRKILESLRETYDLPLALFLMRLLVEEMSMDDFFSLISSAISSETDQKNLWYTLEQNFFQPYSLITGKKIPVSPLKIEKEISRSVSFFASSPKPAIKRFYDFGALAEKTMERFFEIQTDEKERILKDPILHKRLKNILVSHLKDVRDASEVRHALQRSGKIGGMDFREEQVTLLLELLASEKPHLEEYVEEFKIDSEPTRQNREIQIPIEKSSIESDHLLSAPKPAIIPKEKEKPLPPSPPPPITKKVVPKQKPTSNQSAVTVHPRLVGPIEELRGLSLVDFRRLSTNPESAVEKIKERILGLLTESFGKRILAQHAWEESEVYNLYLSLGKESLLSHLSINDIIQGHLLKGDATLTKDEFDAIMELNNALRI